MVTDFKNDLELLIVTGMSGAGKTEAVRSLEDLGFFCVDNLPPNLIPKFMELLAQADPPPKRVALVMDIRGGHFFDSFFEALQLLECEGYDYEILFLEASDEALVRRFKETRRRHPLSTVGEITEGIMKERKRLQDIRGQADIIIDTSDLTPPRLKERIRDLFAHGKSSSLVITIMSFGFKYGLPLDADTVFDVRFLPNPYYEEKLRAKTGEDELVAAYVMHTPAAEAFQRKLTDLLLFLLPWYVVEGKSHFVVAIGCTGGRHRSVALAENLCRAIEEQGYQVTVKHRDKDRNSPTKQGDGPFI